MMDCQAVAEFAADCTKYMLATETQFMTPNRIPAFQTEITEEMRGILNGWLVEVHLKFKLLPETLYICVSIIDRFLEKRFVPRGEYQLLGITAMLIACKYEERYPPVIEDFVHISDNTYSREQMVALEFKILMNLEFNLTFPTCYRFLERFAKIA